MRTPTATIALAALLASGAATAQSDLSDRCYNYANEMVALGHRARVAKCPANATQHMNWDGHYQWCQKQSPGRTKQAADDWSSKLDGCAASGGVAAAPAPAKAPPVCGGVAGSYNGGASTITAASTNDVRVTLGPNRPAGTGLCLGKQLSINFPDDRTLTGTFNGRTIVWSNRTTWTKD